MEEIVLDAEVRGEPESAAPEKKPHKKLKQTQLRSIYGFITAAIPLIAFLIFSVVPLAITISTMFVSMDGYDFSTMKWNSFANFAEAFRDTRFWRSIGVSFTLTVPHMLGLLISLFLSALIAQKLPGHKFFKALYFVPYIVSSVAVAIMWNWVFNPENGILNDIIVRLTGAAHGPQWYKDAGKFTLMLIIIMVWQAPGYGIVMFSAAFTNISPTLYEAAELDGAGAMQKFLHVTLPAITPTIFYLLIAGIIAGLQTFDIPMMFSGSWEGNAGPKDAGLTTVLYIYFQGIGGGSAGKSVNMPVASVMSMFLFIIIFVILFINFKLSDKWVSYDN